MHESNATDMRRGLQIVLVLVLAVTAHASPALSVLDFGAAADASTDDTAAFQRALDEAGKTGAKVIIPPGRYLLAGHLNIPEAVTLKGSFDAPARTHFTEGKLERERGTILLTTAGRGNQHAEPFITLNRASHLSGVIIFYPEQDETNIAEYPWCIRGHGDNCTITNVLMINPYLGVDFGTFPAGRHYINGLYGQPLKLGLFIDKCLDVGRVENVHFWPFWNYGDNLRKYVESNATAFKIAKTDWQYMSNCFALGYAVGFHFTEVNDGPGNVVLTQCGSDIGPLAVKVDASQSHAGIAFLNGQFMAGVDIAESNTGPVKFTNCGFWGVGDTDTHIRIRGSGHVTFNASHFAWWGQVNRESPAIIAESGGLTVSACEFLDEGDFRQHIRLARDVEAAAIFGNRFRSQPQIDNQSEGEVQIGLNVAAKSPGIIRALDEGDPDRVAALWSRRLAQGPLDTFPINIRLASAQALIGSKHQALRTQLLESIAQSPGLEGNAAFVHRAKDELALDAGDNPSRPTLIATRHNTGAQSVNFPPTDPELRTQAAITWDDDALYFAATVHESAMDKLRAIETRQDGRIWTDDSVEIFLSPRRMTHGYLQLIINSAGAHYDGIGTMRTTNAQAWNASPRIKTIRQGDHWIIDLRITWGDLGVPPPRAGDTWAVDIRRWRHAGGTAQYASWSAAAPLIGATHHPEAFGYLKFE